MTVYYVLGTVTLYVVVKWCDNKVGGGSYLLYTVVCVCACWWVVGRAITAERLTPNEARFRILESDLGTDYSEGEEVPAPTPGSSAGASTPAPGIGTNPIPVCNQPRDTYQDRIVSSADEGLPDDQSSDNDDGLDDFSGLADFLPALSASECGQDTRSASPAVFSSGQAVESANGIDNCDRAAEGQSPTPPPAEHPAAPAFVANSNESADKVPSPDMSHSEHASMAQSSGSGVPDNMPPATGESPATGELPVGPVAGTGESASEPPSGSCGDSDGRSGAANQPEEPATPAGTSVVVQADVPELAANPVLGDNAGLSVTHASATVAPAATRPQVMLCSQDLLDQPLQPLTRSAQESGARVSRLPEFLRDPLRGRSSLTRKQADVPEILSGRLGPTHQQELVLSILRGRLGLTREQAIAQSAAPALPPPTAPPAEPTSPASRTSGPSAPSSAAPPVEPTVPTSSAGGPAVPSSAAPPAEPTSPAGKTSGPAAPSPALPRGIKRRWLGCGGGGGKRRALLINPGIGSTFVLVGDSHNESVDDSFCELPNSNGQLSTAKKKPRMRGCRAGHGRNRKRNANRDEVPTQEPNEDPDLEPGEIPTQEPVDDSSNVLAGNLRDGPTDAQPEEQAPPADRTGSSDALGPAATPKWKPTKRGCRGKHGRNRRNPVDAVDELADNPDQGLQVDYNPGLDPSHWDQGGNWEGYCGMDEDTGAGWEMSDDGSESIEASNATLPYWSSVAAATVPVSDSLVHPSSQAGPSLERGWIIYDYRDLVAGTQRARARPSSSGSGQRGGGCQGRGGRSPTTGGQQATARPTSSGSGQRRGRSSPRGAQNPGRGASASGDWRSGQQRNERRRQDEPETAAFTSISIKGRASASRGRGSGRGRGRGASN
ncbi:hypothetical protein LPJ60_001589 [Coemansia sp. RSA 2675]|nr:hypothetical protein LPJ60_001589 [Coemansia sp. RSA 2675]